MGRVERKGKPELQNPLRIVSRPCLSAIPRSDLRDGKT
jgi:hypothetical protein